MNDIIPQNLSPATMAVFCILPLLSVYTLWRIRQSAGTQWLRWNNVTPLPLSWPEIAIALILLALTMRFQPGFTPAIAAGCALIFTQRHRLILGELWGLQPSRFPACFRSGFLAWLASLTPVLVATSLSYLTFQMLGRTDLAQPIVMNFKEGSRAEMIQIFILATIFAPLSEEMIFRGIVYPWLKSRVTQKAALLTSALFFAAIHHHLPTFFPLAVFGLTLALVYEYTGSLVASIALHAIFNFATCLNLLLTRSS